MVTKVKQPRQEAQEEEGSQTQERAPQTAEQSQEVGQPQAAERAPQPEAAQAKQPASAWAGLGPALQEHIEQAVRPVLEEFEQRIARTVRQQLEQAPHEGPQGGEPQQEGEETALSPLQMVAQGTAASLQQAIEWLRKTVQELLQTVLEQTIQWLRTTLQALRQTVQRLLPVVMSTLQTAALQLKDLVTVALRVVAQALATALQQLRGIMQSLFLSAVQQMVRPMLQGAANKSVAAVQKSLQSKVQGRLPAQPAPTGANGSAAS